MSRPRQTVIDTNVMVSISRAPTLPPNDKLTAAVERRKLMVCVDADRGIVSEWEKTAKREVVQQLIIHWQQYKGFQAVPLTQTLPQAVTRAHPRHGYKDTVHKIVDRTAHNSQDKRIVTNDPDFWDPNDRDSLGDPDAPVARLCREQLGITISTLKATVDELAD
jgi:hypothetical protein